MNKRRRCAHGRMKFGREEMYSKEEEGEKGSRKRRTTRWKRKRVKEEEEMKEVEKEEVAMNIVFRATCAAFLVHVKLLTQRIR